MNTETLTKLAIAGGMIFAAYKWGNGMVKGGAIAVAAGIVANQVPYLRDAQNVQLFA